MINESVTAPTAIANVAWRRARLPAMVSTTNMAHGSGIERKHLQLLSLVGGLARVDAGFRKICMQQTLGFHEERAR
jgi:hypothetical protein